MATSRLLKNAATMFFPIGEDDHGRMQWKVARFDKVYVESSRAVTSESKGPRPSDLTTLFVFDERSTVTIDGSLHSAGTVCDSLFDVYRASVEQYAGICYMIPYSAPSATEPPVGCLAVLTVNRRKIGTQRMWHWEVHAK